MSHPSPSSLWERLQTMALVRFLLMFACGWAIVRVLAYFETVVVIFVSATLLAFLLSHPVRLLRRFMPHSWAVFLVFFISLTLIVGLTATLGLAILSQWQRMTESLAVFVTSLAPVLEQVERYLESRNLYLDLHLVGDRFREQALSGITSSLSLLQILLQNLINLIFIAVIAFFMLLDGTRLWKFVLKLVPIHLRDRFSYVIRRNLQNYFWSQLLVGLFFIACTFVAFLALGVPFPLLLAVIAGVFDLIPGIGATLGISLVCLFLLSQSAWLSLKVLLACVLIQQVQENFLLPRLMQNSLNINPVLMFLALLVGARVAGILGIFLAIPIAGVIVSLFEIEEMQARSPVPLPPDPVPSKPH